MAAAVAAAAQERPLRLPAVPDSLRNAADRAAYVLLHYWDGMDWHDTEAMADTAFVERAFADFAAVMPHARVTDMARAVDSLMDAAESAGAAGRIAGIALRYLGEADSPVYCPDCLLPFLARAIARGTASQREIALRDELSALAPGATAPQLLLRAADGDTVPLILSACPTLLLFYDSGCTDCTRLIGRMQSDSALAAVVAGGALRIVAVEMKDNADATPLPSGWTPAGAVNPDDVYVAWQLVRLPSLWLLGSDGHILLRDTTPAAIAATLH